MNAPVFDDFNGPLKSRPRSDLWTYDTGYGWPNGERQTYSTSTNNVYLDGKGHLIIEARADRKAARGYTSGRIKTQDRLDIGYGLTEASIQMPAGTGTLSAFWLLGTNYPTADWPACGEIDIVEYVNIPTTPTEVTAHHTLHGPQDNEADYRPPGAGEYAGWSQKTTLVAFNPTNGYHRYWCNREPNHIAIGIDNDYAVDFTPDGLPDGAHWAFDQPMFAILNLAIGGGWAGNPTIGSYFPKRMAIDWFRHTPA